jgi:hypothetical protein
VSKFILARVPLALLLYALVGIVPAAAFAQTPVSLSITPDRAAQHFDAADAALAKPCTFNYIDTPLRDLVAQLAKQIDVPLVLSKRIQDAGVSFEEPATSTVGRVPLKTGLKLLLSNWNLTYIVQDEVIIITTVEDAQIPENLETRVYPVRDLVHARRERETNFERYDFDPTIELITSTIEPDSWQEVGGPGAISGSDETASLVITTRRDLHDRVGGVLTTMRRARSLQGMRGAELAPARVSGPVSRPLSAGSSPVSRPLDPSGGRAR